MAVSFQLSKNTKPISHLPWLLMFFLFSVDLFSFGSYILIFTIFLYTIFHLREFSLGIPEILLLLFGVLYFLVDSIYNEITVAAFANYAVLPWLVYWAGRNMACHARHENFLIHLITTLSIGFFCHAVLNIIYSMSTSPPTLGNRLLFHFWTKEELSVTCTSLVLCLVLGLSFGRLLTSQNTLGKAFWFSIIGVCIYFSFTWAHRTTVIIIGVLLVNNLIRFFRDHSVKKSQKALVAAILAALLFFVGFCLAFNVAETSSWLRRQWLFQRFTDEEMTSSNGRLIIWKSFFQEFLLHPFGGATMELYQENSYVHNTWLDIYYFCGAVPFLAFTAATVLMIRNIIRYLKLLQIRNSKSERIILVNFFIASFLNLMVEPALQANPYVILALLLICGTLDGMLNKAELYNKNG